MMYPFMTLEDHTEVVHSDVFEDGTVNVYFEKPVMGGFYSAFCILPQFAWKDIDGFSPEEIKRFQEFIETSAQLVFEHL